MFDYNEIIPNGINFPWLRSGTKIIDANEKESKMRETIFIVQHCRYPLNRMAASHRTGERHIRRQTQKAGECTMNHADEKIEELCVYHGIIDTNHLRKYADLVLRHYRMVFGNRSMNESKDQRERNTRKAVSCLQFENHDDRKKVKWSLVYLSGIGELDSMIDAAIENVACEFHEEKEIFTDIYTRYYGDRQNLSEGRLLEVTQYGRTQSYRIKNEALEAFGLCFGQEIMADMAEKMGLIQKNYQFQESDGDRRIMY